MAFQDPFPSFITPGPGPIGGGGGGSGGGGFGEVIGDLGDLVGDIGDLWEQIGGGGSGGGGGIGLPVPIGVPGKDASSLVGAVETKPAIKQAFINFLRSVQVADSWLQNLAGLPTLSWPAFVADVLLIWLSNESPITGTSPGGPETAETIPGNMFGPSTLPTPGGGSGGLIGIPEMGTLGAVAIPAYPTMVYRAPRVRSTVTDPVTGEKWFVKTAVARAMGLVKTRKKAPFKASEWDAMKKASRGETKLVKMINSLSCNYTAKKKTYSRSRK